MTTENQPNPGAQSTTTDKPWYDGSDTETVAWLQNRGLDKLTPVEAAKKAAEGHRNAEKQLGWPAQNLLRMPKDEKDLATREAMYNKLGRPETPDKYNWGELKVSDEFKQFAAPLYHKLGLSQAQVSELLAATATRAEADMKRQKESADIQFATEKAELLKNWGQYAEANLTTAKNAFTKLGFTEEQVNAMQDQIGFAKVMSMFHTIGTKTGEDAWIKGENNGPMTREQASERIKERKLDKAFMARYFNGDLDAKREMNDLHRVASAA